MLRLTSLSKSYAGRVLFDGVDWQTSPGERIGLVGPNGVGKSTLFRILVGEEEPDAGQVHIPKSVDVGYLPQELTVASDEPLLEFILQGAKPLLEMQEQLTALEHRLEGARGEQAEALSHEYGELQERFRRRGGYALRSRAREIAAGMGFVQADFETSLSSFSGGWRMRALISRLLLRRPELLLLDEPTNHLDLESIEWLEGFLRQYEGTIIVISHDRYFLNRIINKIAELRPDGVREYRGSYEDFLRLREEERARLIALAEQQQKEIAQVEEFIERFRYKATKARQVQSRIKQLERMERVEVFDIQRTELDFRFPQPGRLPRIVLETRAVSKAYGENVIYDGLDFQIVRGDKVALVGPNGAGKSTLLKLLAGVLEPDAGEVAAAPGVDVAYFAQHSVEQLDLSRTLLEEMRHAATSETSGRERDILGAFGFSGNNAVERKISVLSGGEKTRLALAKMLMAPAGCLLFDEPTNHLDIDSRQILERAMREFEGAICIVSHDRYFLNQVVERVVHIEDRCVTEYLGDYDYYRWKRDQELEEERASADAAPARGQEASAASGPVVSKKELRRLMAELRERKRVETAELRASLTAVEDEMEEAELRHGELEELLADPELYQDPERLPAITREYQQVGERVEELMERWEDLQLELDVIEQRYQSEEASLQGGS